MVGAQQTLDEMTENQPESSGQGMHVRVCVRRHHSVLVRR